MEDRVARDLDAVQEKFARDNNVEVMPQPVSVTTNVYGPDSDGRIIPMVEVTGPERVMFTPDQARTFAMNLIKAACDVENDTVLVKHLGIMQVHPDQIAKHLTMFRKTRTAFLYSEEKDAERKNT